MGHAHAALRPIGPCGLAVQMPVFIVLLCNRKKERKKVGSMVYVGGRLGKGGTSEKEDDRTPRIK